MNAGYVGKMLEKLDMTVDGLSFISGVSMALEALAV
ncbi:MAG: hypothetical protein UY04_C0013G0010 [Parcubacteria group bacterium GW2011_GWA2_47_7]|nr:MAG: hypothetical protein UY04_C0013G0010 [Parcubacteria group bacterium GW2011_GWA2_47_7]